MVGDTGLEPVTPCMSSKYSNQAELIAHEQSEYSNLLCEVQVLYDQFCTICFLYW